MSQPIEPNKVRFVELIPPTGNDVTFLLLHGLGGSLENWSEVIHPLAAAARTVAVDIPGFGHSRTRRGDFDLDTAAALLVEFCRIRAIFGCVVVVHSTGGLVAARMAAISPSTVGRVVLVDATLSRATEVAQRPSLALRCPRFGLVVAAQFFYGILPVPPGLLTLVARSNALRRLTLWPFVAHPTRIPGPSIRRTLTGSGSLAVLRILMKAKSFDYVGSISLITQPVDLIWGERDKLIAGVDIEDARHMVHVVREREIADCGHWPWIESPMTLAEFIVGATENPKVSQA